jgi:peptidoglycan/LPS O-acetylase OafA/YrhL
MNNLNILTSLRFWLSIWVILFHHETYFHNLPHSLIVLIHKGHVGVNIFFVLSGFVFGLKYKSIQMKVFLKKRISKLFPTYLIALLINTPFIFYLR